MVIQNKIINRIPGALPLFQRKIPSPQKEKKIQQPRIHKISPSVLNSVKGKKSRVPSQEYPEYLESRVSRVSRVSLKNPQEENPRFHEVNAFVSKSERSAVVKTNSVFYSVLVVM